MSRKISIHTFLYLILGLIIISVGLSFWNRYVTSFTLADIERSQEFQDDVHQVCSELPIQLAYYRLAYSVKRDEELLNGIEKTKRNFDQTAQKITNHLSYFDYPEDTKKLFIKYANQYKIKDNAYLSDGLINNDAINLSDIQLKEYQIFFNEILSRQQAIERQLRGDYDWSLADNAIIQIILFVISIPIIITASNQLKREIRERKALIKNLHDNNQKYLYSSENDQSEEAIMNSISAYRKIFSFVDHVAANNYDAAQSLITSNDKIKNENTIIGKLLYMSEQLELNELDKQKKQWVINGLNEFNKILRTNTGHLADLYDNSIRFLCQYSSSLQGYLYVKVKVEEHDILELKACFAYNKKKWITKMMEMHEGLGGQALLEGEYILLKEIPQGYTSITSGLGESTPGNLIILPGINNGEKELVIELASFEEFNTYKIEFLTQAVQSLTATIQAEKNNNKMQELVNKSIQQAEVLREQEEELRQNMEELEATNEAMRRREEELLRNFKLSQL